MRKKKAKASKINDEKILASLERLYPDPKTELNYKSPFELLIATMLSAQTTDRQVNLITEKLFQKYPSPEDISAVAPGQLEEDIKSCGLFKSKAKNIVATCRLLVEKFDSRVPEKFEELISLPGVGRKTANVVLANAFGKEAIAVDTHVFRVSRRLGLARGDTPEKVEEELRYAIPASDWSKAHHWLIFHGRRVCRARKPGCPDCPLNEYCKYFKGREL